MTRHQPGILHTGSPTAFVHVDVDDLWAIGACYGLEVPDDLAGFIYEDAMPRFRALFAECGVPATFFVCGADAANPDKAALLRDLRGDGHLFGNHSHSHALNFRVLDATGIEDEVARAERAIEGAVGAVPRGFRSPGYGFSAALLEVLARRGYAYDSSLMPGPYGGVFRLLDAQLRRAAREHCGGEADAAARKTQYSRLADGRAPLAPYRVDPSAPHRPAPDSRLVEIPAATSPLLRLPFQAGVCMRLGMRYFSAQLSAFRRRPELPLLFLFHGADLADLARAPIPFFRRSSYFSKPAADKFALARAFVRAIRESHRLELAEEWVADRAGR
jgi:hypothetical protein